MNCDCCNKTKNLRPINSGHTLCNRCNLLLIKNSVLRLDSERILEVVGVRGDFLIVKETYNKELDNWARHSLSNLHAQMNNQSPLDYGINPSY